jgi:hypothetical protein
VLPAMMTLVSLATSQMMRLKVTYQLGLSRAQAFESRFVAQGDFAGFHDEGESRVDAISSLLRFLGCHRYAILRDPVRDGRVRSGEDVVKGWKGVRWQWWMCKI